MENNYDFSGWATKNNVRCSDGRTILKDAFKHCDGLKVPLVYGHCHDDPSRVLGHALLENREEGVYTYGYFNDTEQGRMAKELVMHRDVTALSIYANQLKEQNKYVQHGMIREVSIVLAGANPSAYIENVIRHSDDDSDPIVLEDEVRIFTGEEIVLRHADDSEKETKDVAEETAKKNDGEKTIAELFEEKFDDEQKEIVYAMVGLALEANEADEDEKVEHSEGGTDEMKHNVFDQDEVTQENVLSHADQEAILELAKQSNVGSFKLAMSMYQKEHGAMAHGFTTEALTELLPDYENLNPGAPDILRADQTWVMPVIRKIRKSPYSRVRTRKADARIADLRAKGYQKKGDQKRLANTINLIGRTFDPQTVYIREDIHRDDVVDIKDFDYISYTWGLMNDNMYETLALAALVGDGRDDADPDKIHEKHIHSIWNDDELYTIHRTVDIEKAKTELQGSDTSVHFSDNYIYAEAIIMEALYAREKYKGTGKPDLYCAPHLVNVMLLARDLNGRRIYDSKADLAKALNVGEIYEIEQLDGKTRTTDDDKTMKLLGLFVNLSDYQFGSTKGGEVTKFDDFDINFNKYQFLLETRLSGALTEPYSAIALELDVTGEAAG